MKNFFIFLYVFLLFFFVLFSFSVLKHRQSVLPERTNDTNVIEIFLLFFVIHFIFLSLCCVVLFRKGTEPVVSYASALGVDANADSEHKIRLKYLTTSCFYHKRSLVRLWILFKTPERRSENKKKNEE